MDTPVLSLTRRRIGPAGDGARDDPPDTEAPAHHQINQSINQATASIFHYVRVMYVHTFQSILGLGLGLPVSGGFGASCGGGGACC